MDTLFVAPTFLCAASMVAAIDADIVPHSGRLALLITNNTVAPEVTRGLDEQAGFAALSKRFDAVARLNDFISPYHPRSYAPNPVELTTLARKIRAQLGVGDVAIVAQSVHTRPTTTLLDAFPRARVHTISDGLMSYGPTRFAIPNDKSSRLESLLYLDLVPGLEPVLLGEFGVERKVIPSATFRPVVRAYGEAAGYQPKTSDADGLLLGQYLAALGIMTPAEEEALHLEMVRAAHALGLARPAFKPHPSAPPVITSRMEALAGELGMTLLVLADPMPVEVLLEFSPPSVVIGCFSTGLATAAGLFGLDVVTVGTERVARKLPLFEDSNRVPLALSHVAHRRLQLDSEGRAVFTPKGQVNEQQLVQQLGHAMQPRAHTGRAIAGQRSVLEADPSLTAFFEAGPNLVREKVPGTAAQLWTRFTKTPPFARIFRGLRRSARKAKIVYGQLTFNPD